MQSTDTTVGFGNGEAISAASEVGEVLSGRAVAPLESGVDSAACGGYIYAAVAVAKATGVGACGCGL